MSKKVVLITGCSSGIGLECALYLQNKYHIIATARKQDDVEKLGKLGFEAYLLDVCKYEQIDFIFELIENKYPKQLYALFNNAGYGQPGALEDLPLQAIKEQFETNFFGLVYMTQKALPIMRHNNSGRIIQHSSILGLISLRYRGAYNASKYAVEGFCDTLRLELLDTKIYITTLNTGPIRSNFRFNAMNNFLKWVDIQNSNHHVYYENEVSKRLTSTKDNSIFTKNAIVVAEVVEKILITPQPKPRYHITEATSILAFLKRFLPTNLLDKIMVKIT